MNAVARLSPSKINTFRDCPQRFAFRYVEHLQEPENVLMLRGTLVHEVCERLFDLPPAERTRATAVELLHRLWECMLDADPVLADLFADAAGAGAWIISAEQLVAMWFRLEQPAVVPATERELFIEMQAADVVLAGIVDRLDRLPDGTWSITDYKTGPAPRPAWEREGFFQLRFYALVAAESLGLHVTLLRLVHLGGGGEVLELAFDEQGSTAIRRQVQGLSEAMQQAMVTGRWRANVGRQCDWCSFRPRCPAWADAP
jgi:putative RecB family exonuclease